MLSHVSPGLPWEESVRHMNEWALCLQDSGYSPKERYNAIRGACMRQQEMDRMVLSGEIPSINRTRKDIMKMKEEIGGLTPSTWFLRGHTSSNIKCQATPGGSWPKD